MCQHCALVKRQQRRLKDAPDNMYAYDAENERIKAEMARIVDKIEAMAWIAKIENERDYDLYSVYMIYPKGNYRFYSEQEFDKWLADWSDRSHSGA